VTVQATSPSWEGRSLATRGAFGPVWTKLRPSPRCVKWWGTSVASRRKGRALIGLSRVRATDAEGFHFQMQLDVQGTEGSQVVSGNVRLGCARALNGMVAIMHTPRSTENATAS
jgi:hypothetical protein